MCIIKKYLNQMYGERMLENWRNVRIIVLVIVGIIIYKMYMDKVTKKFVKQKFETHLINKKVRW